jgi:glycosidase
LHGITLKLDYLQSQLHVDALRLHSICEANNYLENYLDIVNASSIDPHLGDTTQLYYLLTSLEKRNMSLVLDIPINSIPGVVGNSKVGHREHLLVENVLRFWLLHGIHGFYLKVKHYYLTYISLPRFLTELFLGTRYFCPSSGFVEKHCSMEDFGGLFQQQIF